MAAATTTMATAVILLAAAVIVMAKVRMMATTAMAAVMAEMVARTTAVTGAVFSTAVDGADGKEIGIIRMNNSKWLKIGNRIYQTSQW
jgi:hypothetical protein